MDPLIAGVAGLVLALLFGTGRIGSKKTADQAADALGTPEPGIPNNDEAIVEQEADRPTGLAPGTNTFETENVIAQDVSRNQPIMGSQALDFTQGTQNVYTEPGPPTVGSLAAFCGLVPVEKTDPSTQPSDEVYIE